MREPVTVDVDLNVATDADVEAIINTLAMRRVLRVTATMMRDYAEDETLPQSRRDAWDVSCKRVKEIIASLDAVMPEPLMRFQ